MRTATIARSVFRLPPADESRLAAWSLRLGLFGLAAVFVSIVATRSGFIPPTPALATFVAALAISSVAVLCGLAAGVPIWRDGLTGTPKAIGGIALGLMVLAWPAWLGLQMIRQPAIWDVTTDFADPPRFEVIARVRSGEANPVGYPGGTIADLQRRAWPDLTGLQLTQSPEEAFAIVSDVMRRRRWTVLDERPPRGLRREGRIEAVTRTAIMGFRDDIVVRVRPVRGGSVVDMRSASRFGRHDLGTNAARVEDFLYDVELRSRARR